MKTNPLTTASKEYSLFTDATTEEHSNPINSFENLLLSSQSPIAKITEEEKKNHLSRKDYFAVRNDYEKDLLTLTGMVVHAHNCIFIEREVEKLKNSNKNLSEKEFQTLLETKFPEIILNGLKNQEIDISFYQPKNADKRGYGKYLLFSNKDKSNPYCLQLFVFSSHQKTRLHSHISPCSSTVLSGAIQETIYKPATGSRKGDPLATVVKTRTRAAPSTEGFDENHIAEIHKIQNIHSTKKFETSESNSILFNSDKQINLPSPQLAITVHYYKDMDGVDSEKEEASKLRQTPPELIGKTNASILFRKEK